MRQRRRGELRIPGGGGRKRGQERGGSEAKDKQTDGLLVVR